MTAKPYINVRKQYNPVWSRFRCRCYPFKPTVCTTRIRLWDRPGSASYPNACRFPFEQLERDGGPAACCPQQCAWRCRVAASGLIGKRHFEGWRMAKGDLSGHDRRLGLGESITRRDFIGSTLFGAGATLLSAPHWPHRANGAGNPIPPLGRLRRRRRLRHQQRQHPGRDGCRPRLRDGTQAHWPLHSYRRVIRPRRGGRRTLFRRKQDGVRVTYRRCATMYGAPSACRWNTRPTPKRPMACASPTTATMRCSGASRRR